METINDTARELAESAVRIQNDVNGNPRYYFPVYVFWDLLGEGVRPAGAMKYRGRHFGPGWVFQSYHLEYDLRHALAEA